MNDEQKDALEWLARAVSPMPIMSIGGARQRDEEDRRCRATLKAMLAEPRLPAEPTRETRDVLATAFRRALHGNSLCIGLDIYRALYAHLTRPTTKTVDVWHVEWVLAGYPMLQQHMSKQDADATADHLRKKSLRTDIHVTGPHKQTVPA